MAQALDKGLILLVDDEPGLIAALAMLLEEEGYRVITAQHGGEALERLREQRPDLVITDYMMPYLNGLELSRRLRAEPEWRAIPILLMSAALPGEVDSREYADAYLPKPTDLMELFEVVERLVSD